MTRALVVHHDAESTTGLLGPLLAGRRVEVTEHWICTTPRSPEQTGPLPEATEADLVVVLGSRWSVASDRETVPWIDEELAWLADLHTNGVPILGICFGAQALAAALGGTVQRAPSAEIGWLPIRSDHHAIATGPWFQWHLDAFSVPAGADLLAQSPAGPQAFRSGRSLGVQFHPELDLDLLDRWLGTDADQLADLGVDGNTLLHQTQDRVDRTRPATARLLNWFLRDVAAS
jgi:GMP synthase-like glutamine amidotransferase